MKYIVWTLCILAILAAATIAFRRYRDTHPTPPAGAPTPGAVPPAVGATATATTPTTTTTTAAPTTNRWSWAPWVIGAVIVFSLVMTVFAIIWGTPTDVRPNPLIATKVAPPHVVDTYPSSINITREWSSTPVPGDYKLIAIRNEDVAYEVWTGKEKDKPVPYPRGEMRTIKLPSMDKIYFRVTDAEFANVTLRLTYPPIQ